MKQPQKRVYHGVSPTWEDAIPTTRKLRERDYAKARVHARNYCKPRYRQ